MKRILIIRCGALGDLVYATSVVDALKFEYGDDTIIDFVCTPGPATLFKNDNRINNVFILKHKKVPIWLSSQKKDIIKSSEENIYDILINFESGKQFKSLVDGVNAKLKIGDFFDDIKIDKTMNRGAVIKEYLTTIISLKNLEKAYPSIRTIGIDSLKEEFKLKDNYIVLSPSNSHIKRSGINYRAWDNDKWNELVDKLSQEVQVVVVGAKGEEDFFENFKPYPSNVVDLVAKNNVTQLCTIISKAKGVVCTDSAVGHISAAVNTPVFVLMGPNDTVIDSPYKTVLNDVNVISLELDCSPCYKTEVMKNCKDNICMKQISVNMVCESMKLADLIK